MSTSSAKKQKTDDEDASKGRDSESPNYQTIQEGSVEMQYPADQESAVFYNPVQVQNRDLSILMITLFAEQRAVRLATEAKKKELKESKADNWKEKLQEFRGQLDPSQALADQDPVDGLDILDALAASGLRSIRYWKEIPGVRHITINDLDAAAVERAHNNLQHNNVSDNVIDSKSPRFTTDSSSSTITTTTVTTTTRTRPRGICVQQGDAIHEMYMSRPPASPDLPSAALMRPPWDVIDLDPYGSASPFVDAAMQAIADGGLLCCTCTDMAALGGSNPETCYGRYASIPIQRAGYLQEMALRILLQNLAITAAKYGRTITPRLSVGMNFYVRVFVTVHDDKGGVKKISAQIGKVFQSTQCQSFVVMPDSQMGGKNGTVYQAGRAPPACGETGGPYKVGGPLWIGPLHDPDIITEAMDRLQSDDPTSKPKLEYIATKGRLLGLLENCAAELPDVPLFYKLPDLASLLRVSSPPLIEVQSALVNAGYRVSGFHKEPLAIKTDAPCHVVWDILRAWCALHPPSKAPQEGSAAAIILQNEPTLKDVDFSRPKHGLPKRGKFPMNPESHWGPKKAATGKRKIEN